MSSPTTISVDKPTGERFRDLKPEDMTNTAFLRQLLDALEGDTASDDVTNEDLLTEIRAIPEKTHSHFDTRY